MFHLISLEKSLPGEMQTHLYYFACVSLATILLCLSSLERLQHVILEDSQDNAQAGSDLEEKRNHVRTAVVTREGRVLLPQACVVALC